jgi:cytochrome c oxidase subunit 3
MSPTAGKFQLAHHWSSPEQQLSAGKLGMWLFLGQEVLFFSGVFCAYTIYRNLHPEVFVNAHRFLDVRLGVFYTVLLLFSSLTMALAIRAAQVENKKGIQLNLILTILCGLGFAVVKGWEWSGKISHGLVWGGDFSAYNLEAIPNPDQLHVFFGIYFTMTALHAAHVMIGVGLLVWMLLRANKNEFGPHKYAPLEITGLYWHIVDVIWIFLFPLLYLIH